LSDSSRANAYSSFHDDREKFDTALSKAGGANLPKWHTVVNLKTKKTINVRSRTLGVTLLS
jgi:hypothetical protein